MFWKRLSLLIVTLAVLHGCAGQALLREGRELAVQGQVDEALAKFQQAIALEPNNAEFRSAYIQARERAINEWVKRAERARFQGDTDEAESWFRRILTLESENARATAGLAQIRRSKRHTGLLGEAEAAWKKGDGAAALRSLRTLLTEDPTHQKAGELRRTIDEKLARPTPESVLSAGLKKPITIEFKDTPMRQIFEVISRTSGLNFIFDKDVRTDQRTTVFFRNTTIESAVNMVLLTNQLEQRILDANSILIYPNNPAKARDYQPLTVKSFFLTNATAKDVSNTLKTILKTRDLVVDDRQNMIIMRDTPEAVRMAERLLRLHDLPEPEVMLEVEILEVKRTRLMELGIQWPTQLTLTPLAGAAGGTVTLQNLRNLNSAGLGATLTSTVINARKQDSDANLLANPRIRAKNREKAKILIGDKVPSVTTTSTATGLVAESVQYVDVGLKLEVEPTIYLDNEVGIKISLEVSNIVSTSQTRSGTQTYQIGTRNASTALRLKDGENQVLAGLINDEDRYNNTKVPGLGDIPIVGRLFGSQLDNNQKTEIVLSITPRLIRNIQRPELAEAEFDSGTEGSFRIRTIETVAPGGAAIPVFSQSGSPVVAAASGPSTSSSPAAPGAGASGLLWQGPGQAKVGSTFNVQLMLNAGEPVTSVPLAVGFDPKALEVVSVAEGDLFKQSGGTTNFSNRVDKATGQIFATINRSGADGVTGTGSLINITFKALAPTPEARTQVLTLSAIGRNGRTVATGLPSPQVTSISP